ncbi:MAG: DUF702 domain-containing protein [Kiritimatiellaceae bacterium]|nr:DUF702 domain-containing protein [Kiritimatiellaceae bacterium]
MHLCGNNSARRCVRIRCRWMLKSRKGAVCVPEVKSAKHPEKRRKRKKGSERNLTVQSFATQTH